MYCPRCFNNTLELSRSGVINIVINKKKRDTGKILFNLDKQSKKDLQNSILELAESYFKWYSSFTNSEPISKLFIFSSDFLCSNKCNIPLDAANSIISKFFDLNQAVNTFKELGQKYDLDIEIQGEDN
jgi:hypothetical protein